MTILTCPVGRNTSVRRDGIGPESSAMRPEFCIPNEVILSTRFGRSPFCFWVPWYPSRADLEVRRFSSAPPSFRRKRSFTPVRSDTVQVLFGGRLSVQIGGYDSVRANLIKRSKPKFTWPHRLNVYDNGSWYVCGHKGLWLRHVSVVHYKSNTENTRIRKYHNQRA